jgi:hypothetical protein
MSNFLGNMHTFMHMYMHDKNLIKTKLILLKHVEQLLLLLIKHNVDTTWVLSRPKYFGRQCDINDIQL